MRLKYSRINQKYNLSSPVPITLHKCISQSLLLISAVTTHAKRVILSNVPSDSIIYESRQNKPDPCMIKEPAPAPRTSSQRTRTTECSHRGKLHSPEQGKCRPCPPSLHNIPEATSRQWFSPLSFSRGTISHVSAAQYFSPPRWEKEKCSLSRTPIF